MSSMKLWTLWTLANAAGEMVGLGAVFVIGVTLGTHMKEPRTPAAFISLGMLVIVLAIFEGAVVGLAQWLVLRLAVDTITSKSWMTATIVGAVVAWILGMIPSTIGALSSSDQTSAPPPEPSPVVILAAAAGMGLVLGVVLSFAQWWVLRRHVNRAIWWLPANALAWAAGMPVIFWFVGATIGESQELSSILLLIPGIAVAGAVVGSIHGIVLVRYAQKA